MKSELIPINTSPTGERTVNARDLHAFLENRDKFATWIKDRIKQFGFTANEDYVTFSESSEKGRPSTQWALSLDMAKELSMVERNAKGKQARRYFIECEKSLHQQPDALEDSDELVWLLRAMAKEGFTAQILKTILPTRDYGKPNKNGIPKNGLCRSYYTTRASRRREALKLSLQLQLIDVMTDKQLFLWGGDE